MQARKSIGRYLGSQWDYLFPGFHLGVVRQSNTVSFLQGTSVYAVYASASYIILCTQATSNLIKTKPTYIVVGDIQALPYADELGL
jgi:hypothetical protein